MQYVKVENNQVVKIGLPKTSKLKDGRTVSGYHLLSEEVLRQEGWLPLIDNPPEYNPEMQYIVHDGYEILTDKIIKKYKIENIPEPEPQPSIEEYLLDLDFRISCIELGVI